MDAALPETTPLRHDWTVSEVVALHDLPLLDLLHRAQTIHRAFHPPDTIQLCTLLSVKTGGCPEDCSYCPQSSKYESPVESEKMLDVESVIASARRAREAGSTRFCMGAAWREVKEGPAFDRVLTMVRGVKELGLEACCTLGMLSESQAARPQGRRARRVQPQPRLLQGVLRHDHHDAHLRGPPAHPRPRAQGGHHGVLRRHHRHGREHPRPRSHAGHPRQPRSPPGERAHQRPRPRRGDAPRGPSPGRSHRARPHDRDRAHPDAALDGAPLRGPLVAHRARRSSSA